MSLCKYCAGKIEEMKNLRRLCKAFYELPDCITGGPLHILLDYGNYDDESIKFCAKECHVHFSSSMVFRLGALICAEYAILTLEERCLFHNMWSDESSLLPICVNDNECETCKALWGDELYGRIKLAEMEKKNDQA